MALIATALNPILKYDRNSNKGWGAYILDSKKIKSEHTYTIVLNPYQKEYLKQLEDNKDIKILFKSPLAVNKTPGHGAAPRNTVVVFELKDD
jgi:hypothetical protein